MAELKEEEQINYEVINDTMNQIDAILDKAKQKEQIISFLKLGEQFLDLEQKCKNIANNIINIATTYDSIYKAENQLLKYKNSQDQPNRDKIVERILQDLNQSIYYQDDKYVLVKNLPPVQEALNQYKLKMKNQFSIISELVDDALAKSASFSSNLNFNMIKSGYQQSPFLKEIEDGVCFQGTGALSQAIYSSAVFESGIHSLRIKFEKFEDKKNQIALGYVRDEYKDMYPWLTNEKYTFVSDKADQRFGQLIAQGDSVVALVNFEKNIFAITDQKNNIIYSSAQQISGEKLRFFVMWVNCTAEIRIVESN